MRLWTLHPKYLDTKGLIAVWREGLLAQKVLQGLTKGYKHHPQLYRFKAQTDPLNAIALYLFHIHQESQQRHYQFVYDKISPIRSNMTISVTEGQLQYEWQHLLQKLQQRDVNKYHELLLITQPEPLPLFHIIAGTVETWEIQPDK
jgi:hypothetical protein